ncbi:hypothetical protein BaRGS_00035768 [Batillaria attramentaria]|uniref:Uncharacterized protein n=1 Tax=Batillaria attramentaria TaxID=370345 RepID=A0ABD0JD59_9CAEN
MERGLSRDRGLKQRYGVEWKSGQCSDKDRIHQLHSRDVFQARCKVCEQDSIEGVLKLYGDTELGLPVVHTEVSLSEVDIQAKLDVDIRERVDVDIRDKDLGLKNIWVASDLGWEIRRDSPAAQMRGVTVRHTVDNHGKAPVPEVGLTNMHSLDEKVQRGASMPKGGCSHLRPSLRVKLKKRHVISLVLLAMLTSYSTANPAYNSTSQQLPEECWDSIKRLQECPHPDTSFDRPWTDMNRKCCAGFPGTLLHCQQETSPEGFVLWIFPACLEEVITSNGTSVKLDVGVDGGPALTIFNCSGKWDDEDRRSSQIREADCGHAYSKIDCAEEKGWLKLCDGGGRNDDRCICAPEYEPEGLSRKNLHENCIKGFNEHSNPSCFCKHKPCPPGQMRNITILKGLTCDDFDLWPAPNYTCIPIPTTAVKPDDNSPTSENPRENDNRAGNGGNDVDGDGGEKSDEGGEVQVWKPVVTVLIVGVCVVTLVVLVCNFKRIKSCFSDSRESSPALAADAARSDQVLLPV